MHVRKKHVIDISPTYLVNWSMQPNTIEPYHVVCHIKCIVLTATEPKSMSDAFPPNNTIASSKLTKEQEDVP
jgi:hypothetical protein